MSKFTFVCIMLHHAIFLAYNFTINRLPGLLLITPHAKCFEFNYVCWEKIEHSRNARRTQERAQENVLMFYFL